MKIGAVILAAGSGTRLGGVAKALLPHRAISAADKATFLAAILATARDAGLDDAVVVVGPPFGEEVAAHSRELGASVVVNEAPERGMASSVALGFAAFDALSVDAAWLWPVDHPDVSIATLRALIAGLGPHTAARPVHGERRGHPPLIARGLFPALAACTNLEGGARTVLAAVDVVDVSVDDPGCIRDVDTSTDLETR